MKYLLCDSSKVDNFVVGERYAVFQEHPSDFFETLYTVFDRYDYPARVSLELSILVGTFKLEEE